MHNTRRTAFRFWCRLPLALALYAPFGGLQAWIYPEHRDIALLAVEGLDAEQRGEFDRLWSEARSLSGESLCQTGADTGLGLVPQCVDWAALSGIAGDHACSSQHMLDTVIEADWILTVADIAAQLKMDLERIPVADDATGRPYANSAAQSEITFESGKNRAQRLNALRTADTRLQRADPRYAKRADANLAHFMLGRPGTDLNPDHYAELALKPGSDLNAIGVYTWFHISALQKAGRLSDHTLSSRERAELARAALFDEAFALHFLEDVYASGHVAGSWGDVSSRKGTHDFYNQFGLEVFTWKGRENTIVLMGDAHMRAPDAALAAAAVRNSLVQVLDAAGGRLRDVDLKASATLSTEAETFDVCTNITFPDRGLALGSGGKGPYASVLNTVLLDTPVPGLGPGLGAMPRQRSEVGLFVGLAGAVDARMTDGGFTSVQNKRGWVGSLDLGLRTGVGLEGALGDAGDGLIFGQLGLRADSPSSNNAEGTALASLGGSLSAAVPARTGISARVRMPFYLMPGDLLFLSPMYLLDREQYTEMAITAANGGLIPWQQGWATRFGRFQFVLGREFGVTVFGVMGDNQLVAPSDPPGRPGRVVKYHSLLLDIPIFEYRPYRSFSSNQSSSVLFQVFAGADFPFDDSVVSPRNAPDVNLDPIYSLGLRMVFDWRYYY